MELVLPQNYAEIEQEEMMYLDGGEEIVRGWTAWRTISQMLATSFGWYVTAGKLTLSAAKAAGTGFGLAISVLKLAGATASIISAAWNTAMVLSAIFYTKQYGGFRYGSTGFWVWSWDYVKRI